jgi:hypothetical protein
MNHDAKHASRGDDRQRKRPEEQDAENEWIHARFIGQLPCDD